jgi:hypothetical protein
MEVHHHPDLHHEKKKFREYFLECGYSLIKTNNVADSIAL